MHTHENEYKIGWFDVLRWNESGPETLHAGTLSTKIFPSYDDRNMVNTVGSMLGMGAYNFKVAYY